MSRIFQLVHQHKDRPEVVCTILLYEKYECMLTSSVLEYIFGATNNIDESWVDKIKKNRIFLSCRFEDWVIQQKHCRSTSVGDYVVVNDNGRMEKWVCGNVGWDCTVVQQPL